MGNDISIEEITNLILADYQSFAREDPEFSQPWKITVKGNVIFFNAEILSIKIQRLYDLGGAKPAKLIRLKSFFLNSGNSIQLSDLSLDSQPLKEAVLKNNSVGKKWHPVFDPRKLNGIFTDNENFGLTDQGLFFLIAPYQNGFNNDDFFELIIPWDDLVIPNEVEKFLQ